MTRRLLGLLRAILNQDPELLDTEETRDRLEVELISQGYQKDEISSAFDWIGAASGWEDWAAVPGRFVEVSVREISFEPAAMRLSDSAFRFLVIMRDMGLVDEEMEEEVLNRLMMTRQGVITLEDVKRTAAIVLFEHQFDSAEEYFGIFDEEWRLLFS